MANSELQALFSPPRNAANPKIASTYTPQFSTGDDGKLYKLSSKEDRNKFHILSDAEVEEELRVSQEMANTLRAMNPKKPAKQQTHTVKLGTGSRAKKIEKRAWEKKMASQKQNNEQNEQATEETKGPELSSEDTLLNSVADMQKKYTANLSVIERLISEKVQLEEKLKHVQRDLKKSKKLNQYQSAQQFKKTKNEQLVDGNATIPSVDALKDYYNQNLNLIESLYTQQKITEKKLIEYENIFITMNKEKSMEKDKNNDQKVSKTGTSTSVYTETDTICKSAADTNKKYLRNLTIVEQLFVERKNLTEEVKSLKNQLWSLKRSSAMNENKGDHDGGPRGGVDRDRSQSPTREKFHNLEPSKGCLHHTAPGALQKDLIIDKEIMDHLENEEENEDELPAFEDDDENVGGGDEHVAPTSTPANSNDPSAGGSNVRNVMNLKRSSSPTLGKSKSKDPYMEKIRQSEEKYFEKKKLALEREKQEALEQEMYEYELEQKRLRASKIKHQVVTINGKEKKVIVAEGMSGMAERDKIAEQRRLERAAKKKEADDAATAAQHLAVEEEKKKVEKLTKIIAKNRQKEEAKRKKEQEEKGEVVTDGKKKKEIVEDAPKPKLTPAEITEKLQRQQQAWDAKLAKEKEAKKAKMMQTTQDKAVEDMLKRQEEREEALRKKHKERESAAKQAADALIAEENARKEKLRRKAQQNGAAAKEKAAKEKLEETLKQEEEENKKIAKQKKKAKSTAASAPTYKNAAEMIKALTKGPRGQQPQRTQKEVSLPDGGKVDEKETAEPDEDDNNQEEDNMDDDRVEEDANQDANQDENEEGQGGGEGED